VSAQTFLTVGSTGEGDDMFCLRSLWSPSPRQLFPLDRRAATVPRPKIDTAIATRDIEEDVLTQMMGVDPLQAGSGVPRDVVRSAPLHRQVRFAGNAVEIRPAPLGPVFAGAQRQAAGR